MSRFDRYVLAQLLVSFGFFSLVLVGIYWINQAVVLFDRLIADGQSAGVVFAFTALTLPGAIANVLPLSAFAAAVHVTNRLNSESELVVMQATGFSPFRLAVPYMNFGLLVLLMLSVLVHVLSPAASRETARQQAKLADNVTARFLSPGEFLHPVEGVTFYIADLTPEGILRGLFLTDARAQDRQTTYVAKEAYLLSQEQGPTLVMIEGMAQMLDADGQRLSVTRFDDFAFDISRLVTSARPPQRNASQLSTFELLNANPERIAEIGSSRSNFQYEGHRRFTHSTFAAITTLIGFATLLIGAFTRFGIWRQIVAAILLMIAVKMVDNTATNFVRSTEETWPVLYLPIFVGAILCWGLLKYAGRKRRAPRHQGLGVAA